MVVEMYDLELGARSSVHVQVQPVMVIGGKLLEEKQQQEQQLEQVGNENV